MPGSEADSSQMDDDPAENTEGRKQRGKRRMSRNESEKLRRDKLNTYIAELAKLVPIVASAPRKLDKSSVLRLTVNYLRIHNELKKSKVFNLWRPDFLTQDNLGELLLEAYDGFLLVISEKGTILFVSEMITSMLGHSQVDLLGQSFYLLVHPEDIDLCKEQFQQKTEVKPVEKKTFSNGSNSNDSPASLSTVYLTPTNDRRCFHLRMVNLSNKDQKLYELVSLTCHVRPVLNKERLGGADGSSVVIGVGRLVAHQSIREMSVVPSSRVEFNTQHRMDGKIIFTDKIHAVCMGRLSQEVCGTSAYDYVVPEDLVYIHFSHKKVITDGEIPSTVFRCFSKSGSIVYIQARSSICCDNWTNQPKFILSNNAVISENEYSVLVFKQQQAMLEFEANSNDSNGAESSTSDNSVSEDFQSRKRLRLELAPESLSSGSGLGPKRTLSQDFSSSSSSNTLDCAPHVSEDPSSSPSQDGSFDAEKTTSNQDFNPAATTVSSIPTTSTFHELIHPSVPGPSTSPSLDHSILANLLHARRSATEREPLRASPQSATPASMSDVQSETRSQFAREMMVHPATSSGSSGSSNVLLDDIDTVKGPAVDSINSGLVQNNLQNVPAERMDLKTALIQNQLSQQLEYKYRQLQTNIEKQESELSGLRQQMLKYLLSHPDIQEAYLKRLHCLEVKRRHHQNSLKQLQEIHEAQQKTLAHRLSTPVSTPKSCPAALGSAESHSSVQLEGSPVQTQVSVRTDNPSTQNNIPFHNALPDDFVDFGPVNTMQDSGGIASTSSKPSSNLTTSLQLPENQPSINQQRSTVLSSVGVFENSLLPSSEASPFQSGSDNGFYGHPGVCSALDTTLNSVCGSSAHPSSSEMRSAMVFQDNSVLDGNTQSSDSRSLPTPSNYYPSRTVGSDTGV